ncbi:hypothetical protein BGZ61DRAFT_519014 [Ilyonectria robusta]|uniref:uncharacterized protein n=1 Tax=Ilyonectria robusta TaxID=1079257 RepID=UPI001E8E9A1B|nr:uncharacterized protein BGZ61DRAFT_519014 [Ilyonectria robusta]KAH8686277.1 hypothetical protein BGZ61DRAFT_519014 [Ilyonectria robusta]
MQRNMGQFESSLHNGPASTSSFHINTTSSFISALSVSNGVITLASLHHCPKSRKRRLELSILVIIVPFRRHNHQSSIQQFFSYVSGNVTGGALEFPCVLFAVSVATFPAFSRSSNAPLEVEIPYYHRYRHGRTSLLCQALSAAPGSLHAPQKVTAKMNPSHSNFVETLRVLGRTVKPLKSPSPLTYAEVGKFFPDLQQDHAIVRQPIKLVSYRQNTPIPVDYGLHGQYRHRVITPGMRIPLKVVAPNGSQREVLPLYGLARRGILSPPRNA